MKKWIVFLALLVFTGVIAGCSNSGSEYEGKWIATKDYGMIGVLIYNLDIKRNGDSFLVSGVVFPTNQPFSKGGASLTKDGILQVTPRETFTYVKSDSTLVWNAGEGMVFKRATPEEEKKAKDMYEAGEKRLKR